MGAATLLRELEAARDQYGGNAAAGKSALLDSVPRLRMQSARQVERLHEALCFLRAYPDDAAVLGRVERLLAAFHVRPDARRFRAALADTGIAGTDTRYQFFWFTAQWLAERWPDRLRIEWPAFRNHAQLAPLLPLLVPYAEAAALDDIERPVRRWIESWRGPGETDAAFLVRRFAALRVDPFTAEVLYETLDPPLVLKGDAAPSRTNAYAPGSKVVFRSRPFERQRPDLRRALRVPPRGMRDVQEKEALRLIDLARESMVTRSRDLDSFEHADPADVRLVDCGEGLQFACIGLVPERRALLDGIYGYLTLQNGVPIGYVLTSSLFESSFVAYNVFETFRRAAAAHTYARVLSMIQALLGSTAFVIDPYQLGHDNAEGQKSGAWWFYYKLGFRPADVAVQARVRTELAALRRDPRHRSSRATLQALAAAPLFLYAGRPRADVLGRVTLGNVSLHVSRLLAERGGGHREAAIDACVGEAARLLGVRAPRANESTRRLAWQRWAPLVLVLPAVSRWGAGDCAALVAVIDAKAGRRESDFVRRFDSHRRLRAAILELARRSPPG